METKDVEGASSQMLPSIIRARPEEVSSREAGIRWIMVGSGSMKSQLGRWLGLDVTCRGTSLKGYPREMEERNGCLKKYGKGLKAS